MESKKFEDKDLQKLYDIFKKDSDKKQEKIKKLQDDLNKALKSISKIKPSK